MNKQLQFLHERNFIDTWMEELMANFSNCDTITKIVNSHGEGIRSLSIDHMQSFFNIIFAGLIMASFLFVVEMLEGRNVKPKKRARPSKRPGRNGTKWFYIDQGILRAGRTCSVIFARVLWSHLPKENSPEIVVTSSKMSIPIHGC